jgi:hypothetical protein
MHLVRAEAVKSISNVVEDKINKTVLGGFVTKHSYVTI